MRANSRLLEQLQEIGQEKEQLTQELQEARKVGGAGEPARGGSGLVCGEKAGDMANPLEMGGDGKRQVP